MPSFDLATGYVTFRGNLDKFEQDIIRGQRMVKELDKALDTPAGQMKFKMALDAAKKINQELEKGKNFAKNYMLGGNTQAQQNRQNRDETWLAKLEAKEVKRNQRIAEMAERRQEREENWLARKETMQSRADARMKVRAEDKQNRDELWLARREKREEKMAVKAKADANKKGWNSLAMFGAGSLALGGGALAMGAGGSHLAQSTLQGSWELFMKEAGGTFTPLVKDISKGLQDASKAIRDMPQELKSAANEGAKFALVAGTVASGLALMNGAAKWLMANPIFATLAGGAAILNFSANANQKQAEAVEEGQRNIFSTTKAQALQSEMGVRLSLLKPEYAKTEANENFKKTWEQYEKDRIGHKTAYEAPLTGSMSAMVEAAGLPSDEMAKRAAVLRSGKKLEEAKYLAAEYGGQRFKERPGGDSKKETMLWGNAGSISQMGVADLFKSFQTAGLKGGLEGENAKTDAENQLKLMGQAVRHLESIDRKSGMVR